MIGLMPLLRLISPMWEKNSRRLVLVKFVSQVSSVRKECLHMPPKIRTGVFFPPTKSLEYQAGVFSLVGGVGTPMCPTLADKQNRCFCQCVCPGVIHLRIYFLNTVMKKNTPPSRWLRRQYLVRASWRALGRESWNRGCTC